MSYKDYSYKDFSIVKRYVDTKNRFEPASDFHATKIIAVYAKYFSCYTVTKFGVLEVRIDLGPKGRSPSKVTWLVTSVEKVMFSVCLSVCLFAGLRKNYTTDFQKIR